ncbi:MAG: tetratricopeptide repeat protein, partial [Gemmatimonadales bacterium]
AMGVMTYEMLAGEPPFSGPNAQAIVARVLTERARPLAQLRESVSPQVAAAVHQALQKLPADRFATVAAFAEALQGSAAVTAVPERVRPQLFAVLGVGIVIALGVVFVLLRSPPSPNGGDRTVAVLPFENLGALDDDYFADGIADEVRGKLAALPGLRVIARASSTPYKTSPKEPAAIAKELGVDYLLTGTVRWDKRGAGGSTVHVSPELVEVRAGSRPTTKWQEPFDAELTDVFQVQADIAGRVAQSLDIVLGVRERQLLVEKPTQNVAAYDAYLKGEEISGSLSTADLPTLQRASNYYREATGRDSTFALAWVQLSRAQSLLYFRGQHATVNAALAQDAAERAVALAPERAEAYLALGDYHTNISGSYAEALAQYARGQRLAPRSAVLLTATALAEQRRGQWPASLEHLDQARRLDPRSLFTARRFAFTLLWMRRYQEAATAYGRAFALDSTNVAVLQQKAILYLAQGDLAGARASLRMVPRQVDRSVLVAYMAAYWDMVWLLDAEDHALLARLTPEYFGDNRASWGLALAQEHALSGDLVRSRAYADSARAELETQLRDRPEEAENQILHGLALAYLGRKDTAVREGEAGVAALPVSEDAYVGAYHIHLLARIHTIVGNQEKALDRLEQLFGMPYPMSQGWLRVDPSFASLKNNPRFGKLAGRP